MKDIVVKEGATVYGYIRVSSDQQKNSREAQTKVLRDWAASELQYPIDEDNFVYDEHISAAQMRFDERPGGSELVRRCRPGDVIMGVRLERISRQGDDIRLLNELARQGIQVGGVEDGTADLENYMERYHRDLEIVNAQKDSGRISARVRETMAWLKSMGRPVNGRGRYGHTIEHGKNGAVFEFNEEEMQLIREASERRLSGEPCRKIAADFTRRGHASPLINGKTGQPRPWNRHRVLRVTLQYWLQNEIEPPEHAVCDRPTAEEQEERELERLAWAQNKPVYIIKGKRHQRLPESESCDECSAGQGMYHVPGCSLEECPVCEKHRFRCRCRPRLPRTKVGSVL